MAEQWDVLLEGNQVRDRVSLGMLGHLSSEVAVAVNYLMALDSLNETLAGVTVQRLFYYCQISPS